jgi:Na+/proline symporter
MSIVDWIVLFLTLGVIVIYGIYKSKHRNTLDSYLVANRQLPWYHVCLSVMATQASAITFLSAPGQAFSDGMRFVQFYFGLPLAMIVLCVSFIPAFNKINIYTAYEYLEKRFDHKVRKFTAFLFLLQRGLSTGISIYAPSIVLSTILNIDSTYTTLIIGLMVLSYTIYGGTLAVSYTQVLQMTIIFSSIIIAGVLAVMLLEKDATAYESLKVAGIHGKMKIIDFSFDLNNRYNIWSGLVGGFFLQLSYFGTDQSQVGRYLTGKNNSESKTGLLMNAVLKIPMQFIILLIGILVFSFYQFKPQPLYFNPNIPNMVENTSAFKQFEHLQHQYDSVNLIKTQKTKSYIALIRNETSIQSSSIENEIKAESVMANNIKKKADTLIKQIAPNADINDSNYVFLHFVKDNFPIGMVGLVIAIIFLASMGSLSAGINSLSSTTTVDFYMPLKFQSTESKRLKMSKLFTLIWGLFCIACALLANNIGNLLEAVNILGSLFYGTILGIFVAALYFKNIKSDAVFKAAILTELIVIIMWYFDVLAFLWLNMAGCLLLIVLGMIFQFFSKDNGTLINHRV